MADGPERPSWFWRLPVARRLAAWWRRPWTVEYRSPVEPECTDPDCPLCRMGID